MVIARKEAELIAYRMAMEYSPDIVTVSKPKIQTVEVGKKKFWEVIYSIEEELGLPRGNLKAKKVGPKITRSIVVTINKKTGERSICTRG